MNDSLIFDSLAVSHSCRPDSRFKKFSIPLFRVKFYVGLGGGRRVWSGK